MVFNEFFYRPRMLLLLGELLPYIIACSIGWVHQFPDEIHVPKPLMIFAFTLAYTHWIYDIVTLKLGHNAPRVSPIRKDPAEQCFTDLIRSGTVAPLVAKGIYIAFDHLYADATDQIPWFSLPMYAYIAFPCLLTVGLLFSKRVTTERYQDFEANLFIYYGRWSHRNRVDRNKNRRNRNGRNRNARYQIIHDLIGKFQGAARNVYRFLSLHVFSYRCFLLFLEVLPHILFASFWLSPLNPLNSESVPTTPEQPENSNHVYGSNFIYWGALAQIVLGSLAILSGFDLEFPLQVGGLVEEQTPVEATILHGIRIVTGAIVFCN